VRLWDPESGQLLQVIKGTKKKNSELSQRDIARWSPNGQFLMTAANENQTIQVWEVSPGR
jgi:WD40 repeat protein